MASDPPPLTSLTDWHVGIAAKPNHYEVRMEFSDPAVARKWAVYLLDLKEPSDDR